MRYFPLTCGLGLFKTSIAHLSNGAIPSCEAVVACGFLAQSWNHVSQSSGSGIRLCLSGLTPSPVEGPQVRM